MRKFNPGASADDDYEYGCDVCGKYNVFPVLVWKGADLPGKNRSHFSICMSCLSDLYFEHANPYEKSEEAIFIKRAVITEEVRNRVFERDRYRCVRCGNDKDLSIDHIIPFSKGGLTKEENFQTLCKSCNSRKGNLWDG